MNQFSVLNIVKNIFQRKLYLFILISTILLISLSTITSIKIVYPLFYNELMKNIIDESNKVGNHLAHYHIKDIQKNEFKDRVNSLIEDFKLERVKLFDEKGYVLYSNNEKDLGTLNTHDYFHEKVVKGEIFYKVVEKGTKTLENRVISKDVAEIYIPFMDENKFIGALEIYYDITEKKDSIYDLINKINKINLTISLSLLLFVFIMLYNASKNSLQKEDEIDKNLQKERLLFNQSKLASMGEMIGNIAHQWRQPLSAISTASSGMKLQKQLGLLDDQYFDEATNMILKNSNYMSHTIDDFRNFFKTDKEEAYFDIYDLLKANINIVSSNFKNNSIKIIEDFNSLTLYGIKNELFQVIINILNNARDAHNKSNNENKLVFLSTIEKDGYINIIIKDNAGGIDESIIDKIFEPYFTTKHQSVGTGIGLYMSMEIIQKHFGGNIFINNVKYEYDGKTLEGAQFTIKIPIKKEDKPS